VGELGTTLPDFIKWLESQFHPHPETGEFMTLENFGKWHIDHAISLDSFGIELEHKETQLKASHFTNLQPLWEKENLSKHTKCYYKHSEIELWSV